MMKYNPDEYDALVELLGLVSGDQSKVSHLAKELLSHFGTLVALVTANERSLQSFGLETPWVRLVAASGAVVRRCRLGLELNGVPEASAYFEYLRDEPQETLVLVTLSGVNEPLRVREIFRGTLTAAIVHPREIIRAALEDNAARILIGHNHPQGPARPSTEDMEFTSQLALAANLMGIKVVDHVILGRRGTFSFTQARLL